MHGKIATLIVAAFAAGCTSTPEPQYVGKPLSPEEKRATLAYVKEKFFDPYSIRSASIAPGTRAAPSGMSGRVVCYRLNAKNQYGAYTGMQTWGVAVKDGKAVGSSLLWPHGLPGDFFCPDAKWEPWPEAEAIK